QSMSAWRVLIVAAVCVSLYLPVAQTRDPQTYPLAEAVQPRDCFRVRLDMKLDGEMTVQRLNKPAKLWLNAAGLHEEPEHGRSVRKNGVPDKAARVYEAAKATISVDSDTSERSLRDDRRLIVAQRHKDQPLVYSPAGALTRAELDLTSDTFDTLAVVGLLPGK